MILVDSSVLIDIVGGQSTWADWSEQQLLKAKPKHDLAINLLIYAELSRDFASKSTLDEFLGDIGVRIEPLSGDIAFLAARAHQGYRAQGGQRSATLPDFFIGAHASNAKCSLLTRDPKRIRTYFPDVLVICPE
jgi:predicted nucleic acid-binding protein